MDKRDFNFEMKQLETGVDPDYFFFAGHLAAFDNIDYGNDKLLKGSTVDSTKEMLSNGDESLPVFWVHKNSEPVGVMPLTQLKEEDYGLAFQAKLPKADTFVAGRVIPQMQVGSIKKMSMGYSVIKTRPGTGGVRILEKVRLWEGSLVPIAMNDRARVTEMKAVNTNPLLPIAPRETHWDIEGALGRIREWAGISPNDSSSLLDPDIQRKYAQAFFFVDHEEPDWKNSYKLPFADIVQGELTAIPRAIFQAALWLQQRRVGIYYGEAPDVARAVEKYYEAMNIPSPFGRIFRVDDLTGMTPETMGMLLETGVRFGAEAKQQLITNFEQEQFNEQEVLAYLDGLLNKNRR